MVSLDADNLAKEVDEKMALDYIWQKLYEAVYAIAIGNGTIQERLGSAYANYLGRLITTNRHDIPEEILDDLLELERALMREEIRPDEGLAGALARTMGEVEAHQHVMTILSMYDRVAKRDPLNEYHRKSSS